MTISKQHIPKIIHQIAPNDRSKWHPLWETCRQSWQKTFPDYELKLWNDESDIDDLIETHFPQFAKTYHSFPYKIMKINFARFAMLHHFGGIYSDMDIFCYKNFEHILQTHDLFLLENILSETVNGHFPFEICLMTSSKTNSYMFDCMTNSIEQFQSIGHLFNRDNIDPEWLIVMLTDNIAVQSRDVHNPEQILLFPYSTFNNRAASYHESFYTKHMRSSAWNRSKTPTHYLIVDNLMFAVDSDDIETLKSTIAEYETVPIESFDFYKDYTKGMFFTGNKENDIELETRTQARYNEIINT
jgi:hypothetical protein